MAVRTSSTNLGDVECRALKKKLGREVYVLTGNRPEINLALDQLARYAINAGITI